MENETIQYYDEHAAEFADATENADMEFCRDQFLKRIGPWARILDAGCGGGRDTQAFLDAGYKVEAFDASEKLCEIASAKTGIPVKHMRFEELEEEGRYHAIWACASLLHVKKADLPDVAARLYRALKPGGVLYASFKLGTEERDWYGRYYCDMTEESIRELYENAGFAVEEVFLTRDVRPDRTEVWVNAIGAKPAR